MLQVGATEEEEEEEEEDSSRTMALASAQPLTERSSRNLPGCKGRPACKANNLTAICEPIFYKM
jgi:hypothetical protein